MRKGNTLRQSLDYLKLVKRAAFHRHLGLKIFLCEPCLGNYQRTRTKFVNYLQGFNIIAILFWG